MCSAFRDTSPAEEHVTSSVFLCEASPSSYCVKGPTAYGVGLPTPAGVTLRFQVWGQGTEQYQLCLTSSAFLGSDSGVRQICDFSHLVDLRENGGIMVDPGASVAETEKNRDSKKQPEHRGLAPASSSCCLLEGTGATYCLPELFYHLFAKTLTISKLTGSTLASLY